MEKKIDQESVIPLYHQLKEIIREHIQSGEWNPGDKIPSENQICEKYNISRNTAKKALEDLVQDGLLKRIQGKGTFVAKPVLEQSLTGFYSFSKVMQEKGMDPKDLIIDIETKPAGPKVAHRLQIAEEEQVIVLTRLRCANDEPIILESSYMPQTVIPELTREKLEKTSLYDYMEQEYGVFVSSAKEIFEPVLVRSDESRYLQVEVGSPALLLERVAYNTEHKPVEFCHSIVRGDRCRFYTELI